jgi:hypothetical protein
MQVPYFKCVSMCLYTCTHECAYVQLTLCVIPYGAVLFAHGSMRLALAHLYTEMCARDVMYACVFKHS